MANEEHLEILKSGVEAWNTWRRENKLVRPELYQANLSGANLNGANLNGANFIGANLSGANLIRANIRGAKLSGANFSGANLIGANLIGAKLRGATLNRANFSGANLDAADLGKAGLLETLFIDVDLSSTKGLEDCMHYGRSNPDYRTIAKSKNVPLVFWRGCGLPDRLIDYMPSLTGDAIQFYSCFISYSSTDQEFADRLHADLQNAGVRCWFAPHDLPIGAKTWDGIDQAIRTRDKVLLILSEGALDSEWVEDEVTKAFAEERRRKELVLFPVRLDSAVMETDEPWAGKLRDNRNIGDFTSWKDHDAYKKTFDRVLRDLKPTNGEEG